MLGFIVCMILAAYGHWIWGILAMIVVEAVVSAMTD